ncbi:hypothetical protein NHF50_06620 [Flavobacterium sp. NRK F10]|uniref:hypothetical protein n=1 Tax=Flavobacterium sp. NRK F10 TaxID=2954931 RepID=UPI0020909E93|nr:hypothetical protein [Flavobacterium sp. NRK F10]MCO6174715.1 hypothetical protein [Flavobacterium sp. NRK F10]
MKEKVLKIAENFLEREKIKIIDNSLEYLSFRKEMDLMNNQKKDVHVVGFLSDFNTTSVDGIKGGTIYIDDLTNKIVMFVTPYFMKRFED